MTNEPSVYSFPQNATCRLCAKSDALYEMRQLWDRHIKYREVKFAGELKQERAHDIQFYIWYSFKKYLTMAMSHWWKFEFRKTLTASWLPKYFFFQKSSNQSNFNIDISIHLFIGLNPCRNEDFGKCSSAEREVCSTRFYEPGKWK